jgi:hypothetical protein
MACYKSALVFNVAVSPPAGIGVEVKTSKEQPVQRNWKELVCWVCPFSFASFSLAQWCIVW